LVVIHLWRSVQSGKNDKGKIKLLQAQNVAADGAKEREERFLRLLSPMTIKQNFM
jgi:hypothetical protein